MTFRTMSEQPTHEEYAEYVRQCFALPGTLRTAWYACFVEAEQTVSGLQAMKDADIIVDYAIRFAPLWGEATLSLRPHVPLEHIGIDLILQPFAKEET